MGLNIHPAILLFLAGALDGELGTIAGERNLRFLRTRLLSDSRSLMATNQSPPLADVFLTNARDAAATVERVSASPAAVFEALERATKGARSIVVAAGEWLPPEILSLPPAFPHLITTPSP